MTEVLNSSTGDSEKDVEKTKLNDDVDDAKEVDKEEATEIKENGHEADEKSDGLDADENSESKEDSESDEDKPKAQSGWVYLDDDADDMVGTLEQDPLLEPGKKREVKKTQWLSLTMNENAASPKENKTVIPEGKGTKLGDMPRVDRELNRTNGEDLKPLHRFLFGKAGKTFEVKKNIRKFNGFAFEVDSQEYKKKMDFAEKFTIAGLKFVCEILDLERGGTKGDLENRLMEHLMEPRSSGKPIPGKKRKMSADKKKRKEKRKKVEGVKIKLGAKPKKTPKKPKKETEVSDVSDLSDSDQDEDEKPPAKKQKTEETKKKSPKKTVTPKSTPKPKKSPKKAPKSSSKESSDSDDSDDEPLITKKKKAPTNGEIKKVIKKILTGADLEECTMKTVLSQVYNKYPDFDLSDRKDFMKLTIREMIS